MSLKFVVLSEVFVCKADENAAEGSLSVKKLHRPVEAFSYVRGFEKYTIFATMPAIIATAPISALYSRCFQ
jgi:hypothetical protein